MACARRGRPRCRMPEAAGKVHRGTPGPNGRFSGATRGQRVAYGTRAPVPSGFARECVAPRLRKKVPGGPRTPGGAVSRTPVPAGDRDDLLTVIVRPRQPLPSQQRPHRRGPGPARCEGVPAITGTDSHRADRALPEPGPAWGSRAGSDTRDARDRFPRPSLEKSRTHATSGRLWDRRPGGRWGCCGGCVRRGYRDPRHGGPVRSLTIRRGGPVRSLTIRRGGLVRSLTIRRGGLVRSLTIMSARERVSRGRGRRRLGLGSSDRIGATATRAGLVSLGRVCPGW
jgi:hypothetical protein